MMYHLVMNEVKDSENNEPVITLSTDGTLRLEDGRLIHATVSKTENIGEISRTTFVFKSSDIKKLLHQE